MDSFFFNITDRKYKSTELFKKGNSCIRRVDISNGIIFFDINLEDNKQMHFPIKNLDRMVVLTAVKEGSFSLYDHIQEKQFKSKQGNINVYCSSQQNFTLTMHESKKSNIFILFIADFFLKRYLSSIKMEPVDYLYEKIQGQTPLLLMDEQPIDALSFYLIEKILNAKSHNNMNSIRCEHSVIEFMIHRFSLFDIYDKSINEDELYIAKRAKAHLLNNFVMPPTIKVLAHICATNESTLKVAFKKVYKVTIYSYIQKLRLEKANILLKDRVLNIGEIAKDVGYKHQGHFSKLFFETYGVYPKDLLKCSNA